MSTAAPTGNRIYLSRSHASACVGSRLVDLIGTSNVSALGMATAFLSFNGASEYHDLFTSAGATTSKVVIGLSGEISHPRAIELLIAKNHSVRLGRFPGGIFHPKLLVGGDRFIKSGHLRLPSCGYVGSANFTRSGLRKNLEIMLATHDHNVAVEIAEAFSTIWHEAAPASVSALDDYERAFARAQRRRSLADLELLDVVDSSPTRPNGTLPNLVPPRFCTAVWTGLQSFTGEHTFQVEFPRKAGEALRTLLGTDSGDVRIECVDGQTRSMTFGYYTDNGMYRLNVPNSMPLVEWARTNHQGALLVWQDDSGDGGPLNAEIVRGRRLADSIARSRAMGSWGQTKTREYGWY
jgi:hypothetical protein